MKEGKIASLTDLIALVENALPEYRRTCGPRKKLPLAEAPLFR